MSQRNINIQNMLARVRSLQRFYKSWQACKGFKPHTVEWIISAKCNLKCLMCNVWKIGNANPLLCKNELSLNEVKVILEEIARLGTKFLTLSGGEPTLRSDLLDIIRKAKEEGLTVTLITNGTLITPYLAEKLVKSGIDQITFSIDAPKPGPHDIIRGVKGTWEKAINGIKLTSHMRTKHKVNKLRISVFFLVTRINYELIPQMVNLKSKLGFDEIHFLPVVLKANRTNDLLLTYEDLEKLWGLIPTIKAKMEKNKLPLNPLALLVYLCKNRESTVEGKYAVPARRRIMCFQPWKMATIDPFGNVYSCCYAATFQNVPDEHIDDFWKVDKFNLGNLRESTFEDIWNGNKFVWFRGKSKQPLAFQICNVCQYNYMRDMFYTGLFAKRPRLLLTYLNEYMRALYDVTQCNYSY